MSSVDRGTLVVSRLFTHRVNNAGAERCSGAVTMYALETATCPMPSPAALLADSLGDFHAARRFPSPRHYLRECPGLMWMTCVAFLAFWLLTQTVQAEGCLLVRAPINGRSINGLAGTSLTLTSDFPEPVRAWVGIHVDESGGKSLQQIVRRHERWVRDYLMPEHVAEDARPSRQHAANHAALLRHCCELQPAYFDAVLVEFPPTVEMASGSCCWFIDDNLDGFLSVGEVVQTDASIETTTEVSTDTRGCCYFILAIESDPPKWSFRVAATDPVNDDVANRSLLQNAAGAAISRASKGEEGIPPAMQVRVERLRQLDTVVARKQQLPNIVALADQVIAEIDDRQTTPQMKLLLAELLYRKGRALGYMELPDVIARHPVKDPAALDAAFEAAFQRLDALVDTKAPEYILLRIRRQRRRDLRGLALDLVDTYRRTHPTPVWHYKKRFDLLNEIGARLPAHQAAAELWLHADKPDRPEVIVFQQEGDEGDELRNRIRASAVPLSGFQQIESGVQHNVRYREAVVWARVSASSSTGVTNAAETSSGSLRTSGGRPLFGRCICLKGRLGM